MILHFCFLVLGAMRIETSFGVHLVGFLCGILLYIYIGVRRRYKISCGHLSLCMFFLVFLRFWMSVEHWFSHDDSISCIDLRMYEV